MTEVADGTQLAGELDAVCRAVNCRTVRSGAADSGRPPRRVTRGPLSGVEGTLQVDKLLLPLTCLDKAVAVEVDAAFVSPVN